MNDNTSIFCKNNYDPPPMESPVVQIALSNYDIGNIISVQTNNIGRHTHYIANTNKGKFFIKVLDCKNENVHMNEEILVCEI